MFQAIERCPSDSNPLLARCPPPFSHDTLLPGHRNNQSIQTHLCCANQRPLEPPANVKSGRFSDWTLMELSEFYCKSITDTLKHKVPIRIVSRTTRKFLIYTLLKIKVPKGWFHSDATEEPFLVPQRTFQWRVLKRTNFLCEEHFKHLNNLLSIGKVYGCWRFFMEPLMPIKNLYFKSV